MRTERTDERTELYIHSLERELLYSKTQYRALVVDRAQLIQKLRVIHGVLEDKQRQVGQLLVLFFWIIFICHITPLFHA